MNIDQLERRFGATAVAKGFITIDQLMEALQIQVTENIEERKHRLIGRILFDLGFLTLPQIDEVLTSMRLPTTKELNEWDRC